MLLGLVSTLELEMVILPVLQSENCILCARFISDGFLLFHCSGVSGEIKKRSAEKRTHIFVN